MFETLTSLAIVIFGTASLKLSWFNTLLPVHVYHILHKLGFNLGISDWDDFNEHESTYEDWEFKVTTSKYPLLSNLLTCPICLSFHISFWLSLVTYTVAILSEINVSWLLIPISVLVVPYIVNRILK